MTRAVTDIDEKKAYLAEQKRAAATKSESYDGEAMSQTLQLDAIDAWDKELEQVRAIQWIPYLLPPASPPPHPISA